MARQSRQARIRFVTDGFDRAGPRNAPKSAQIALRPKREQDAFRRAPDSGRLLRSERMTIDARKIHAVSTTQMALLIAWLATLVICFQGYLFVLGLSGRYPRCGAIQLSGVSAGGHRLGDVMGRLRLSEAHERFQHRFDCGSGPTVRVERESGHTTWESVCRAAVSRPLVRSSVHGTLTGATFRFSAVAHVPSTPRTS